jgi:hypothetical protein
VIPTRTVSVDLPLTKTFVYEASVGTSDPAEAFDAVTAYLDVRLGDGAAVLSLATGQPPTPGGSSLAITEQTATRVALHLTIGFADLAKLAPRTLYRSDLLFAWPGGRVECPRRIHWRTDRAFTRPSALAGAA